jgi:hypothetical protein
MPGSWRSSRTCPPSAWIPPGNNPGAAASSVSSIAFGYIVGSTGSYDAPFIPMVAWLCVGVWVWLKVDPEHQLCADDQAEAAGAPAL